MVQAEIIEVIKGSLAHRYGLVAGDRLLSINGRKLRDILDYEISVADTKLEVEFTRNGVVEKIMLDNPNMESLGVRFDTSLFDGIKTCANKCVFCFIDQLPPGMRDAVYVKDDDYRLSFLYGNFVTLTNIGDSDIERIINDRISPLYVSLHTTNNQLRAQMLGRKKQDNTLENLKRLSDAGIEIHIQMVMCPGLNDANELDRSIEELASDFNSVESIGLVPVGLTSYRSGLYSLKPFDKQGIASMVKQVERWQQKFENQKGYAWVYIADEFYIAGGYRIPDAGHYAGFPQIENGIGLSRLFIDEVSDRARDLKGRGADNKSIAVITGELFAPILKDLVEDIRKASGLDIEVIATRNKYFGGEVNVTGLLTGSDIIDSASDWFLTNEKPYVLAIPDVVLNSDGLMLDGYSPQDASKKLGLRVEVFNSSGSGLIEGLVKHDISLGGGSRSPKCW